MEFRSHHRWIVTFISEKMKKIKIVIQKLQKKTRAQFVFIYYFNKDHV